MNENNTFLALEISICTSEIVNLVGQLKTVKMWFKQFIEFKPVTFKKPWTSFRKFLALESENVEFFRHGITNQQ